MWAGPKIPPNAEQIGGVGASATKSKIAKWFEKMFLASTGLDSNPSCVVLPKTKILVASSKLILATTHFRFCEAMESKIPRLLSKSSRQRPARKLRN